MRNARLPLAGPVELTAQRIALCAVVLAGAAAAVPVCTAVMVPLNLGAEDSLRTEHLVLAVVVALSTVLLSGIHGRLVSFTTAESVLLPSIGWAVRLGAMNGFITNSIATALGLFRGGGLFLEVVVGGMCAAIVGMAFGLLFGFAYALPLWVARRARECRAHDDAERALVWCGLWLVPMGVLGAAVPLAAWCKAIGALIALIGLASAGAGAFLRRRRKRWLYAVMAGKIRDFAVTDEVEASELPALIPFCRQGSDLYPAVLVERMPAGMGAYRKAAARALALVAAPLTDTAGTALPRSIRA